jgi:NADPH:quinone reductase
MMRVVRCNGFGEADVLQLQNASIPKINDFQVRIRVVAVGINRADLLQRRGLYSPPSHIPSDILGLEYAGEILEVGAAVQKWNVGQRVMGILAGATYAEQVIAHEREILSIPSTMNYIQAAAIPEAFLTAFDALFPQLEVHMGERVLIHAIGSGVGNAALQLVKATGGFAIGTSRTKSKIQRSQEFGLDEGIHVQDGSFSEALSAPVHKILDFVGGSYLEQNMRSLQKQGEMIVVGLLGGRSAEINLGLLLRNRLRIRGTVLRMRPLEEKIALVQAFTKGGLPLFETGLIRPVVDRVFDMTEMVQAHLYMESNQNFGKIVVKW